MRQNWGEKNLPVISARRRLSLSNRPMKASDYEILIASLDRAVEVLEAHPARFGLEAELHGRLLEIRTEAVRSREQAVQGEEQQ